MWRVGGGAESVGAALYSPARPAGAMSHNNLECYHVAPLMHPKQTNHPTKLHSTNYARTARYARHGALLCASLSTPVPRSTHRRTAFLSTAHHTRIYYTTPKCNTTLRRLFVSKFSACSSALPQSVLAAVACLSAAAACIQHRDLCTLRQQLAPSPWTPRLL